MLILSVLLFSVAGCKHSSENRSLIAEGERLATKGEGPVPACASCHGQNGEGNNITAFPRLAGLNKDYLAKQLRDMAREMPPEGVVMDPVARDYSKTPRVNSDLTVFTPGLRHAPVMSPLAKNLSEQQINAVSAYYASLSYTAKPLPADYQTLERGADLALRGKPEYGLPACVSCHAPNGEGFGADFPPLAGQPPKYLIEQIDKWQTGERDNDPLALMKAVANQLTDADKINAAAYFANRSLVVKGQ